MKNYAQIPFLTQIVIALTMLLFIQCKEEDPDPDPDPKENIKVGLLAELTGTFANNSNYDAAQLAVNEINAAGGIDGRNLELVLKDAYADKGQIALESVKELKADGIDFVIGPGWSSRTMIVADYTISNNMLLMPTTATASNITDLEDNGLVWRSIVPDALLADALADYLYTTKGVKTAAIIYRDDAWGSGIASNFTTRFTSLGGSVVASIDHESEVEDFSTFDFTTHCQDLMDAQPEILIYLNFDTGSVKFLNDLSQNGTYTGLSEKPDIYSFAGNGIELLTSNAPAEILPYIHSVEAIADESDGSNFSIFKTAYSATYPNSDVANYQASCAYDNTYLLAYAMLAAGDVSSATTVASKLQEVSGNSSGATVINVNEFTKAKQLIEGGSAIDYNGASGKIEFSDKGDPTNAIIKIAKIEGNEYMPVSVKEFQN